MSWQPGDVVVERQVWHGQVMAAMPAIVIEATTDHVVSYIPPGAPFWFPADPIYPGPTGRHPWYGRSGWTGHGKLTITPTTGHYAVSHFWSGEDRQFVCWYLNIQEQMRTTSIGFDSQDLELDIVVKPDRSWELKDDDVLDERVADGRWTPAEAAVIRGIGARIIAEVLTPDRWWWDTKWAHWQPDATVIAPEFPDGWASLAVVPFAGLVV